MKRHPNQFPQNSIQYFSNLQCFMVLSVVWIISYVKKQNALDSKWNIVLKYAVSNTGRKFELDFPIDPAKSVKTGRLLVALGELTHVCWAFYLAMENCYKKGV